MATRTKRVRVDPPLASSHAASVAGLQSQTGVTQDASTTALILQPPFGNPVLGSNSGTTRGAGGNLVQPPAGIAMTSGSMIASGAPISSATVASLHSTTTASIATSGDSGSNQISPSSIVVLNFGSYELKYGFADWHNPRRRRMVVATRIPNSARLHHSQNALDPIFKGFPQPAIVPTHQDPNIDVLTSNEFEAFTQYEIDQEIAKLRGTATGSVVDDAYGDDEDVDPWDVELAPLERRLFATKGCSQMVQELNRSRDTLANTVARVAIQNYARASRQGTKATAALIQFQMSTESFQLDESKGSDFAPKPFHEDNLLRPEPHIQIITGEDALRIAPTEPFVVSTPFRRGMLRGSYGSNPYASGLRHSILSAHPPSCARALGHLRAVVFDALEDLFACTPDVAKCAEYSVVAVLPDAWPASDVSRIASLLLQDLGFRELGIARESVAGCFGAGVSTACIADIGEQKTTVACVVDGHVVPGSLVCLGYGGGDVTAAFRWMLHRECKLKEEEKAATAAAAASASASAETTADGDQVSSEGAASTQPESSPSETKVSAEASAPLLPAIRPRENNGELTPPTRALTPFLAISPATSPLALAQITLAKERLCRIQAERSPAERGSSGPTYYDNPDGRRGYILVDWTTDAAGKEHRIEYTIEPGLAAFVAPMVLFFPGLIHPLSTLYSFPSFRSWMQTDDPTYRQSRHVLAHLTGSQFTTSLHQLLAPRLTDETPVTNEATPQSDETSPTKTEAMGEEDTAELIDLDVVWTNWRLHWTNTHMPLHRAVTKSLLAVPAGEVRERLAGQVLLIGGGSKIPGTYEMFEEQLFEWLPLKDPSIRLVGASRDLKVDVAVTSWRGAAVAFSGDTALSSSAYANKSGTSTGIPPPNPSPNDVSVWISKSEWEVYGYTLLRDRVMWSW